MTVVNRKELLAVIGTVRKAADNPWGSVPKGRVQVKVDADTITVTGGGPKAQLELAVMLAAASESGEGTWDRVVRVSDLVAGLRAFRCDTVTLHADEVNRIRIHADTYDEADHRTFRIVDDGITIDPKVWLPAINLDAMTTVETIEFDAAHTAALRRVRPCASRDEARAVLCTAHVFPDAVYATDSYQLARIPGEYLTADDTLLVPVALIDYAPVEGPWTIERYDPEDQKASGYWETTVGPLTARVQTASYSDRMTPLTRDQMNGFCDDGSDRCSVTVPADKLIAALPVVTVLVATGRDKGSATPIRLQASADDPPFRLSTPGRIQATDPPMAQATCPDAVYAGNDLDVYVNPVILKTALLPHGTNPVRIFGQDRLKPVTFKSEDCTTVVMPVRVS